MAKGQFNLGLGKKSTSEDAKKESDLATLYGREQGREMEVPLGEIDPNPFQPRHDFDAAGLVELASSIRQFGFLGGLHARERGGRYQIAFGERRLRACREAGLERIPLRIHDYTDDQMLEIALVENLQRRDLRPLEEAAAFRVMQERGLSIRDIGARIGKDKGYVENRLALLKAPADVQQMVATRPDTVSVAREIAKLPDERQRSELIQRVQAGSASAREVRAEVARVVPPKPQVTVPSRREKEAEPSLPMPTVSAAGVPATDADLVSPTESSPSGGLRRDEPVHLVQAASDRALQSLNALRAMDWTKVDDQLRDRSLRVLDALIAGIEEIQFQIAPRRRPRLVAGPATRRG